MFIKYLFKYTKADMAKKKKNNNETKSITEVTKKRLTKKIKKCIELMFTRI